MKSFEENLNKFAAIPQWNQIVEIVAEVPPLSKTVQDAIDFLQQPEVDLKKLSEILEKDVGLSSKILKVANSPLFARPRETTSVLSATSIMGLKTLRAIIVSASFKESINLDSQYLKFSWYKGLTVSTALRMTCEKLSTDFSDELTTIGILHVLGDLVLGSHPVIKASLNEAYTYAVENKDDLTFLIEDRIGFKPSLVSAMLLKKWSFPEEVCLINLHRETPIEMLDWPLKPLKKLALFQATCWLFEKNFFNLTEKSLASRFCESVKKVQLFNFELLEQQVFEVLRAVDLERLEF